jgi:phosphoribosylformylglycinamidine (FGAM) synthase PurS component
VSVRARVLIRPKAGILDPQGEAVQRALPALGEHCAYKHSKKLLRTLPTEGPKW